MFSRFLHFYGTIGWGDIVSKKSDFRTVYLVSKILINILKNFLIDAENM